MVKGDIVQELGELGYVKYQMPSTIDDIFRIIGKGLVRGESVMLRGFGKFELKKHNGHTIIHARTGKPVTYEEYYTVKFTPGATLKEAIRTKDESILSSGGE